MSLTGKPKVTKLQVGQTGYWIENGVVRSGTITKVIVTMTNPANDLTGIQDNIYIINGQQIPDSKIRRTVTGALALSKGGYVNNWSNMASEVGFAGFSAGIGCDISYSNFTNCYFSAYTVNEDELNPAELDSTNLDGCNFTGCNMEGVRFGSSSVRDCDFTGANIADAYFEGADLTGSTMPEGLDDPEAFQTAVNNHVDGDTTWIDGSHPFPVS